MASAAQEEIEKANAKAAAARAAARDAKDEAQEARRKARAAKREAEDETNHILVRLTSQVAGTAASFGGAYVWARYLGPNRKVLGKDSETTLSWGATIGALGTVIGLGAVAMEDTWVEPVFAVVGEGLKSAGTMEITAAGLKARQKALDEAAKKK